MILGCKLAGFKQHCVDIPNTELYYYLENSMGSWRLCICICGMLGAVVVSKLQHPQQFFSRSWLEKTRNISIYWIFKHRGEVYMYLTCSCNQFAQNQSICAHFVQIKRIEVWGHEKLAPNTFQNLKAVLWKDWSVHKGSNHPKSLKEKVESLLHLACQDIKCVSLFW